MDLIKGITYAPFAKRGDFTNKQAYDSLDKLRIRTGADFVLFVPAGIQKNAYSEEIDYTSDHTVSDDELIKMMEYAKKLGLRVGIKPTVNCLDGTWRAHINFFDEDVPCEPKWSNWFSSYTKFQTHYAGIANDLRCELFITGCEMVMTERREIEWRRLIAEIKKIYKGLISYNTDKYQEHNVKWWDCVDVISSSGYYPIHDWDKQLDRIEKVVEQFEKPFFFAEVGCMSTKNAEFIPNEWNLKGEVEQLGQEEWYRTMFAATVKRPWVQGHIVWDWPSKLYLTDEAETDGGYNIYGKRAEKIVYDYYNEIER